VSPPLVSVVLPTYERREAVLRAVGSVLRQRFRDFELIVVDDGSTDGTGSALAGLGGVVRYEWQENRGVSSARNAGIRLARGRIVALLDADDRWLPHHLDVVTEVLGRHPEAVLCATCPRFYVGGRQPARSAEVIDALPLLLVENVVGCPAGVAVRREAILAAGGYDERLHVMEGWELWRRLALRGPFAFLRRRTIVFQATEGSLSRRSSRAGSYSDAGLHGIVAASAALVAADPGRSDGAELRSRTAGAGAYLEALRALAGGDETGFATALGEACARLPELSTEAELVAKRLALVCPGARARLRAYRAAALVWPDPRAVTPLYLRLHALALALALGRRSELTRLLRDWPLAAMPGFLARNPELFGRLARQTLQKRRYRGRESARVAAADPRSSSPSAYDASTTERR
jgi:hypothetical protein